jgi:hypothetical protein
VEGVPLARGAAACGGVRRGMGAGGRAVGGTVGGAVTAGRAVAAGASVAGGRVWTGDGSGAGDALGLCAAAVRLGSGDRKAFGPASAGGGLANERTGEAEGAGEAIAAGSRFVKYEMPAPIPNPARITTSIAGMRGKLDSTGRRRGGRAPITRSFAREPRPASHAGSGRAHQEAGAPAANGTA